jgi:hypothetical protein
LAGCILFEVLKYERVDMLKFVITFFPTSTRKLIPLLFLVLLVVSSTSSQAQKQLIFIYRGDVIARFTEGDNFRFRMKSGRKVGGFIVEMNDYSMVTSNDTLQYLSIGRIRGLSRTRTNKGISGLLFLGGLGYLAIDNLNKALGYNKGGWDNGDWTALTMAGVGSAMIFIKPRYTRLKPGTIVRSIDYRSPYYKLPEQ